MSYLHFGPYLFFPPVYLISPSPVSFFSGLSSLLVASTSSQLMQDFPHLPTQGNGRILIIFNQIQLFCGNLANEAVMQHISIFWPFIPVTSLPSLHRGSGPWKRTHIDIFVVSERTAQQRAPPRRSPAIQSSVALPTWKILAKLRLEIGGMWIHILWFWPWCWQWRMCRNSRKSSPGITIPLSPSLQSFLLRRQALCFY